LGFEFDSERGVIALKHPLERLLAEALLPFGMRLPKSRGCEGALLSARTGSHGQLLVLFEVNGPSAARGGASSRSSGEYEARDRVHFEMRRAKGVLQAMRASHLERAAELLQAIEKDLEPTWNAELHAWLAIDGGNGFSASKIADPLILSWFEAFHGIRSLRHLETALGLCGIGQEIQLRISKWLSVEPSHIFAGTALLAWAQEVRPQHLGLSRWLAKQAAERLGHLPHVPQEAMPFVALAVVWSEGAISAALAKDLLHLLGWPVAEGMASPYPLALALLLEASDQVELAERIWREVESGADPEAEPFLARRDEKRGLHLRAFERWQNVAHRWRSEGRKAEARSAFFEVLRLALQLGLRDEARVAAEEILDFGLALEPRELACLASQMRRYQLHFGDGFDRLGKLVMQAIEIDRGETPELVAALEELLEQAIETGRGIQAKAFASLLRRIRPDRVDSELEAQIEASEKRKAEGEPS
ncbi:MAG: hypothetical protein N2515_09615, partial [Deltaproteobacteria bacterium]|nr:hypothetical protein [Deltaproteobacteria bacterium]